MCPTRLAWLDFAWRMLEILHMTLPAFLVPVVTNLRILHPTTAKRLIGKY